MCVCLKWADHETNCEAIRVLIASPLRELYRSNEPRLPHNVTAPDLPVQLMPPYLPPELVDNIIASITDESLPQLNRILLKCALICRDWLPASRSRLLQFVDLTSATAYNSFVDNLLHPPHSNPYLAATESVWLTDPSGHSPSGERQQWTHRFIHDFAGHLPNLESLTIENADWISRPPHPHAHLAISRFSLLKELSLYDCKLPSAHMLRRMVSVLSSLENLQLVNVTWPHARGGDLATCYRDSARTALKTLYLMKYRVDDCLAPFLHWLSHTPTRGSLRDLSFRFARADTSLHAHEYMGFVEAVTPGLVKLDISLPLLEDLALRSLKSLQELKFNIGRRSQGHWHTVARMLHDLPIQSRIHHLGFSVWLKTRQLPGPVILEQPLRPATIEDDGLERLEAILQRGAFRGLQSIDFAVRGLESYSESEAADAEARILHLVQQKLPKTSTALGGIISVRWTGLVQV
ncbi:hypothetical protein L226DRAFT_50144 [Lentinus tigrinus ALCF2SS1-7]|uniref:uncharacterized protein n=1 Tax=Lentinus tigrinus ALCF2SS1-7 TaxID=1328758 RepID=UPI001165FF75|nr:hypothetical protein L226DRAFT_50144 [Lentinus tigrinus ALCF2SS1-7]